MSHHHYEDNEDRRFFRKERKLAQARDRSKYKKSDQDKREASSLPEGKRGRVTSITIQGITVDIEGETLECSLRGTLKQERTDKKNLVTVGDFVWVDDRGQIAHVEERSSYLARSSDKGQHFIAANVDQVLITSSVESPTLKTSLIDRYIIAAKKGNMEPVVVINKIDLGKDPTLLEELTEIYKKAGILCIKVSAATGVGMLELQKIISNKTSVFSGQSGVGKTSLINQLMDLSFKTRAVVRKTQKGAHTTTSATLIPLKDGGFCVDTPGIKSFGLPPITPQEFATYFSDLTEHAHLCKFPNCAHTHEPHCAVRAATESGKLSPIRYHSYLSLQDAGNQD